MSDSKMHPVRILNKLYLILSLSYKNQNFLGQKWIPWFLNLTPENFRKKAALHILGISPHYFIYQWSKRYPSTFSRQHILELEDARNRQSREKIIKALVLPHLSSDKAVLDFGCGPGWLSGQVAPYVKSVTSLDISCGAIACAQQINFAKNIKYICIGESGLFPEVPDGSIDLLITFAVLQHIPNSLVEIILSEFARVLKKDGKAICHWALTDTRDNKSTESTHSLLMIYRSNKEVKTMAQKAGFKSIEIKTVREMRNDVVDDIADQHISFLEK